MPRSYLAAVCIILILLTGCSNNLYFGTATSIGLDVSGTSKVPNSVSFAYDRGEVAIIPEDANGDRHSVFGSLDSEWTWFNGFILKQEYAVGKAADLASRHWKSEIKDEDKVCTESRGYSEKPLLFVTGTKLGIDIEFGQTTDAPASLLIGYRRSEMSLIPDAKGKKEIAPLYADIAINSASSTSSVSNKLQGANAMPRIGGVRIIQRIATGKAAINAASDPTVRRKLQEAVYGDSNLASMAEKTDKLRIQAEIHESFDALSNDRKQSYLAELNEDLNNAEEERITLSDFGPRLATLSHDELQLALDLFQQM